MPDTPVVQAGQAGWLRINLGHLLTIAAMVIGFLLSNQSFQDKVSQLQLDETNLKNNDLADIKTSLKAIELSNAAATLSMKDVQAKLSEHDKTNEYFGKRFENEDNRITAVESQVSTLNTNLQLVNQQLQYIGTSHIVQPSTKK